MDSLMARRSLFCPLQDEGRKQMKAIFTGALHRHGEFDLNSRRTVHRGCHTGRAATSKILKTSNDNEHSSEESLAVKRVWGLIPCCVILQKTRSCQRAPAPCQTQRLTTTVSHVQNHHLMGKCHILHDKHRWRQKCLSVAHSNSHSEGEKVNVVQKLQ